MIASPRGGGFSGPPFLIPCHKQYSMRKMRIFLDFVAHVAYKNDMNSREVLKRLEKEGFVRVSQRGSHMKLRHEDGRIVIVPHPKKDLPPGTLHNIEEQSKIKF